MRKKFVFKSHYYPEILFKQPWLILFYYLFTLIFYPRYLIFIAEFIKILKNRRPEKILEIGYGEGLHLMLFSVLYRKTTFYAYDIRDENRLFVQRFCAVFGIKNIHLLKQSDFCSLSISTFDLVYMVGVLQYVEKDQELLIKIKRILKSDGQLMIYQPIRYKRYLQVVNTFIDSYEHYEKEAGIKRWYSEDSFINLLKSSGFTVYFSKKYAFKIYSVAHELMLFFYVPLIKDERIPVKLLSIIGFITVAPAVVFANAVDPLIRIGKNNALLTVATLEPIDEMINVVGDGNFF